MAAADRIREFHASQSELHSIEIPAAPPYQYVQLATFTKRQEKAARGEVGYDDGHLENSVWLCAVQSDAVGTANKKTLSHQPVRVTTLGTM